MIIRRLSQHLAAQNWTAVALDFVVVVLGVYLGVLLGNLNAASLATRSEKAVLTQLHGEILAAEATFVDTYIYDPERTAQIAQLVNGFYHDGEVPDEWVCAAVRTSTIMFDPVGELSAVAELIATGRLSQVGDEDLREAIADYHEVASYNDAIMTEYRAQSIDLVAAFPDYAQISVMIGEDGQVVQTTGECDVSAMRADPAFRSAFARNIDVYDAWYRRIVLGTRSALLDLHERTDAALGVRHEEDGSP